MLDRAVGGIVEAAPEGTRVFVVSDHGFAPFYCMFDATGWLIDRGYTVQRATKAGSSARSRGSACSTPPHWLPATAARRGARRSTRRRPHARRGGRSEHGPDVRRRRLVVDSRVCDARRRHPRQRARSRAARDRRSTRRSGARARHPRRARRAHLPERRDALRVRHACRRCVLGAGRGPGTGRRDAAAPGRIRGSRRRAQVPRRPPPQFG